MVFCCKITITNSEGRKLILTAANEIEIDKTWRKYTDTATIKFPKGISYRVGNILFPIESIKELIKTSDTVKIELGYNRELRTEFEGYVSRVQPTIPVEVNFEDEMFKMKRTTVSVHIEDATVRQILEAAAPGYEIECADELYGDFSMDTTTPAKVFDELKKTAGLYTFFRGKRLICGLPYSDKGISSKVPNFVFGKNIIDNSLKYIAPEDCKLKYYGRSFQKNGTSINYNKGEEGGTVIRWNQDFLTKKELEKLINDRYEKEKSFGGYAGDITSFGFPVVEHGQTIRVVDPGIYEKRDSIHYIDAVKINVSTSGGYRRTCSVGKFVTQKKLL